MASYDSWKDADMECCFFRTQNKSARRVGCEGFLPRSTIIHTFRRQKDFDVHLARYCAANYAQCPYYKALMKEKYDETR